MDIPILFEDDHILIIDKPAGLLSTGGGFTKDLPYLQGMLEPKVGRLWLVHRLDRDTSGVMILAKTADSHRTLNLAFDHREIQKTYLAIILGNPDWTSYDCDLPLKVDGDRAHRTRITEDGKPATTSFQVLQSFSDTSLVQAKPHTGLTHQIRAHLSGLNHPILMDDLYTFSEMRSLYQGVLDDPVVNASIHRIALHALQVEFIHPVLQTPISVQAPLPADMSGTIKHLQAASGQ